MRRARSAPSAHRSAPSATAFAGAAAASAEAKRESSIAVMRHAAERRTDSRGKAPGKGAFSRNPMGRRLSLPLSLWGNGGAARTKPLQSGGGFSEGQGLSWCVGGALCMDAYSQHLKVSAQAIGVWRLDSQRGAWALREAAACGNGKRLCTLAQCATQTPPPPLSELPAPSFAAHDGGHFLPPLSTRTSSQHFPGEVHRVCRYYSPGILNCCCTGTIC